jgi:hypothetical protein
LTLAIGSFGLLPRAWGLFVLRYLKTRMIKIKIANKTYKVRNQWKDLTPSVLHSITSKVPFDVVRSMSDIPTDLLDQLDANSILSLYELCAFVLEDYTLPIKVVKQINVGEETFKKVELAKQAIQRGVNPYTAVSLCGVYFGEVVYKWRLSSIYGQTYQILNSLSVFLERYKELSEGNEYNDDELEAGVQGFETFGVGAVIIGLANGVPSEEKFIEESKAEWVYFKLLFAKAQSKYQKELKRIYDRQNGINTRNNSNGN